mgnify:CR=1 FL=1
MKQIKKFFGQGTAKHSLSLVLVLILVSLLALWASGCTNESKERSGKKLKAKAATGKDKKTSGAAFDNEDTDADKAAKKKKTDANGGNVDADEGKHEEDFEDDEEFEDDEDSDDFEDVDHLEEVKHQEDSEDTEHKDTNPKSDDQEELEEHENSDESDDDEGVFVNSEDDYEDYEDYEDIEPVEADAKDDSQGESESKGKSDVDSKSKSKSDVDSKDKINNKGKKENAQEVPTAEITDFIHQVDLRLYTLAGWVEKEEEATIDPEVFMDDSLNPYHLILDPEYSTMQKLQDAVTQVFDADYARRLFTIFNAEYADLTNFWEKDNRLYVRQDKLKFHEIIPKNYYTGEGPIAISIKPFSDPAAPYPLYEVKTTDNQGKTVLLMLKEVKGHFYVTCLLTAGPDYKGFVPTKEFEKIKSEVNAIIQAENQFITGNGMQLADDYEEVDDSWLVEVTDPRFPTIEALRTEAKKYFTDEFIKKMQFFEGDPHLYEEHHGKVYRGVSGEPWEAEKIENCQAVRLNDGNILICFPVPRDVTICYRLTKEDGHWKLAATDENLELFYFSEEDEEEDEN